MRFKERGIYSVKELNHKGVSGAHLVTGTYERGGLSIPVIIKKGQDIYLKEIRGARLLRGHLPIIEPLDRIDDDTAIYPLVGNAKSLNDIYIGEEQESGNFQLLEQYLQMHVNLWNSTHVLSRKNQVGYSKKIDDTYEAILNNPIGLNHIRERFDQPLSINLIRHNDINQVRENHNIYSMTEALEWMRESIKGSLKYGTCLTHGDENFDNCLVRDPNAIGVNYTNPLVMIDLNGTGYRSPFEPIVKISSWLRASQVEHLGYKYGTSPDLSGTQLIVNYSLNNRYEDIEKRSIEYAKNESHVFKNMDNDTFQNYLNAYQMMYFLREAVFYADLRQRSQAVPYLVGKAFSLAENN